MLDGKKKVIFIAGLIFSLVLLILFVFSSSQNISFFTGKYIDENIPSAGNENEIVKNVFLDEYIPKSQGQEEIFFDKKFYDNGRYIINSLNEYSAEWYPDNSPKRDLKKLTIELQITDKETGKSFSIKGTADIPKYYSGHFNFDTSQENFVVFSDLRPDFVWEYSEDFSIVEVKKGEEIIETENKLKTETFVKEKKFDNYKKLDSENKDKIPKELFLDPDISTCGTLDQTGQIYTLTQNVSSSGTCFTITNPNIILDCQNYWITYSTGSGTPYYGVYSNEVNTTIKNCNIYSANRTIGYWYSAGIQLQNAHNSTLINNYANTVSSQGIMLSGTNYSNLIINRGVTSYSQGIRLDISSYNYLVNNTGVSLVNEATGFTWGARHNLAINHTAIGNDERGIYFSYDSNYNTLINPNSTGKYAFQFSNSSNNTIIDCINAQGTSYDVYHNDNSIISTNNTFLNCSYDSEYLHSSNSINRKWYYQAYTNYSNGTAVAGANITAYNSSGNIQFAKQTNSSGWIPRQEVTEYVNRGGTRSYYNNYTINASKSGYVTDSNVFNFTTTKNKVNDVFTLQGQGLQCGTLDSENTIYILSSNVSSNGTCFTVTQPNITLDCNGYWINYTGNDTGYYFGIETNQFNTTVRNCNIYNYTIGIFFNGADNGTIENNNIILYNNKTLPTTVIDYGLTPRASGILIHDSANYNTIVNNTAYSRYGRGIYINTASNNIIKNSNGSSYFNPGIQVYGGLGHEGSHNSIINSFGLSEESNGIRLGYYGYYDSIINSTAISNLDYAILADYGEFIDVINSFANSSSNTGIHFLGIQNGKIINSTGVSGYSQGIIIDYESNNNLISNSTGIGHHTGIEIGWNTFSPSSNNTLIDSKGTGGISGIRLGGINNTAIRNSAKGDNEAYYLANLNNSRIIDCVYTNGGLQDIYYSDGLSRNNTFLNCSYDDEFFTGSSGELIRKWYYQAYTNYSNGTAVAGANITAYNSSGNIQFAKQTNSSGWIPRQEVTEYVNRGGTRSYYNNYTINASKSGYVTDNNLFNFTITQNKVDDFFTLFLSTCNYSSGNWLINCSENCYIDSNYNIGKNNISIIGVGTVTLSGNISNYNKLLIAGQNSSNICTVRCINGGCFKF